MTYTIFYPISTMEFSLPFDMEFSLPLTSDKDRQCEQAEIADTLKPKR